MSHSAMKLRRYGASNDICSPEALKRFLIQSHKKTRTNFASVGSKFHYLKLQKQNSAFGAKAYRQEVGNT